MLGPHWDSAPGCPVPASVSWRSCSFGSAGPATSQAAQIIDGVNIGMGQFITLILGLGCYRSGQPTSLPLFSTTRVRSSALSWLVHRNIYAQGSKAISPASPMGHFLHTYTLRASSIVLPRWGAGSTLLSAAACERQDSSPTCHRQQGAEKMRGVSFNSTTIWRMRGRARSLTLTFSGQVTRTPPSH